MSANSSDLRFGAFRLDVRGARLFKGEEQVALTPKAFSLLEYMARRPDQLLSKDELLDELWKDTMVGDAVLKVAMRELRKALGDDVREPSFIATVHRRGYRFIAEVRDALGAQPAAPKPHTSDTTLVGRLDALTRIQARFDAASSGSRRMVFVTGEPGIGKTCLVDGFLRDVTERGLVLCARGNCIEHYGVGEPYLPLLEAVGNLCRREAPDFFVEALVKFAPTWVAQLPMLLERFGADRVRRETLGATSERMLREMADLLDFASSEVPIVLALEDLHWCDLSTLELLSLVARRASPAKLLILGTCRRGELDLGDTRRRRMLVSLLALPTVEELPLQAFTVDDVRAFLVRRFDGALPGKALVDDLHARTGGQPLFLTHAVDDLVERSVIESDGATIHVRGLADQVSKGVPHGIHPLIEERLARLEAEDRRLLEIGAVAGHHFGVDVAAVVSGLSAADLEARADRLSQGHGLLRPLELVAASDGTLHSWYAFGHALIRDTIYVGLPALQRARMHARIATALESRYGDRDEARTAELAMHFEAGKQAARAIHYLLRAAKIATRRYANDAALLHLDRARDLLGEVRGIEAAELARDLLRERGFVQRSMGDMKGASSTWQELAQLARDATDIDAEIEGLLLLSSALFWVDREDCLAAVDRVREIASAASSTKLTAHALGWCGHWNVNLRGWTEADASDALRAVEACRADDDQELLGLHLVRSTYLHMLRSDYGAAVDASIEGTALALERGDAFDYLLGHFLRAWTLFHAGRWNELSQCIQHGQYVARRNRHEVWDHLFGLIEAQLRTEACDHGTAAAICRRAIAFGEAHPDKAGQLVFHGKIVIGLALLGHGDLAAADEAWSAVEDRIATKPHEADWMLHLPLRWGRARLAYQQGDTQGAVHAAEQLLDLASRSGEKTYIAMAHAITALAWCSKGDMAAARRALALATKLTDDGSSPLAAWRVHCTSAACASSRVKASEAQARARAALDGLVKELRPGQSALAEALTHAKDSLVEAAPTQRLRKSEDAAN